jgi:hypothetical protein
MRGKKPEVGALLDAYVREFKAARGSDGRFGTGRRRDLARAAIVDHVSRLEGAIKSAKHQLVRFTQTRRVGRSGMEELASVLHDLRAAIPDEE